MRTLTIAFHQAGGGHRNAAEALKTTLTSQADPWDVTLLDTQDLLDPLDLIRRATGFRIQDTYNLILRRGWTRFTPQLLKVLQATIYVYHSPIVKVFKEYWAKHPTDIVLSVIPHFNREIAESVRASANKPPFVTLITDFADYPPRFWIERNSEYIITGTEKGRQQALAMGHASDHVFLTSGMVLKPKFYEPIRVERAAERRRAGLDPERLTGIVLFGGSGSGVMIDIAKSFDRTDRAPQLILICGHNQKLENELKALPTKSPKLVLGFTQNVERYMAISDFFIGKPGPGSISEALQLHLPVIVERNAKTMPQERYNTEWVAEKGVGIVVDDFKKIAPAVERLTEPAAFQQFRQNAASYSNRALNEVSEIHEKCYAGTRTPEELLAQPTP